MSYDQAMKHWANHRKDKYFQPCSGPVPEACSVAVDAATEDRLSLESMKKILGEDHVFPIYLAQTSNGVWEKVARNRISCVLCRDRENLERFAEDYVFSQVRMEATE